MSKKNNYKVYVHINKVNGKRYYGITKKEKVEYRWNNGKGYKRQSRFYNAIKKYGWNEGFEHIVLFDNLTEEEAKLLEQMYIALYDTKNRKYGYNQTNGGDGVSGYEVTEEHRKKLSESHKGKQVGKDNPMAKSVYIIELDKNFDTITECAKYLGCKKSSISSVLRGEGKTCKGYHIIWIKDKNNKDKINKVMNIKNKPNPNIKSVYVIELDMIFNSINECAKYLGCKSSYSISSVLRGEGKTCKGYHIIYTKDVNQENINKVMSEEYNVNGNKGKNKSKNNYNTTKIYCVELDMYFDTTTEASKYIGCNSSNILKVLKGKRKTCSGYHWIYAEDVEIENSKVS